MTRTPQRRAHPNLLDSSKDTKDVSCLFCSWIELLVTHDSDDPLLGTKLVAPFNPAPAPALRESNAARLRNPTSSLDRQYRHPPIHRQPLPNLHHQISPPNPRDLPLFLPLFFLLQQPHHRRGEQACLSDSEVRYRVEPAHPRIRTRANVLIEMSRPRRGGEAFSRVSRRGWEEERRTDGRG